MNLPNRCSLLHWVNIENSAPTTQISQVRLHTTVGVPEKEISFSNSFGLGREDKGETEERGNWVSPPSLDRFLLRKNERKWGTKEWKLTRTVLCKDLSTKISSSSVKGIWRAINEGLKTAKALTILKTSAFSKLDKNRRVGQSAKPFQPLQNYPLPTFQCNVSTKNDNPQYKEKV